MVLGPSSRLEMLALSEGGSLALSIFFTPEMCTLLVRELDDQHIRY